MMETDFNFKNYQVNLTSFERLTNFLQIELFEQIGLDIQK